MKNDEFIKKITQDLCEKIDNCITRISASGVPHLIVDSHFSICFFYKSRVYKIWKDYGTPKNKQVGVFNTAEEVISKIEELRRERCQQ